MVKKILEIYIWRLAALAAGFVTSIWTARCLGPVNLGASAVVLAAIAQVGLIFSVIPDQVNVRLYRRGSMEDKLHIVGQVVTIRMVVAIGLAVFALVFAAFLNEASLYRTGLLAAIPLLVVSYNSPSWLFQAEENQSAQFKMAALASVVTAVLTVLLFRPGQSCGSDIIVYSVGIVTSFVYGWYVAGYGRIWRIIKWEFTRGMVLKIKSSAWVFATQIVMYLYVYFDVPMLAYMRPLQEVGVYRTAVTFAAVVQSFVSVSSLVLYPRLIVWAKDEPDRLWRRQLLVSGIFCACAVIIGVGVYFIAPRMYTIILGEQFVSGAVPFSLLVFAKLLVAGNGVFAWGLWAQDRDKSVFAVMLVTALLSIGLNYYLIPKYGMRAAAATSVISEIGVLAGTFALSWRGERRRSKFFQQSIVLAPTNG